jgi:hypothetical protein
MMCHAISSKMYQSVLALPLLLVLAVACSNAAPASNTQPVSVTQPTSAALPGSSAVSNPAASQAPQVQLTFPPTASQVTITPPAIVSTFDNLVAGTVALRKVKVSLSTIQPDGSLTSLQAEIDASGNQHILQTYPPISTTLSISGTLVAESGTPNPPITYEMYVLDGVAYIPDQDGVIRPADTQSMTDTLQGAILSPDGPAFWMKILPAGSFTPQGIEQTGGFQAKKYAIQGVMDKGTITGSLWVTPDKQTLLAAQLSIPAQIALSGSTGTVQINFQVEQADIAPIQPQTASALPTETASLELPTEAITRTPPSSASWLPASVPLYQDAVIQMNQPGTLIYQSSASLETVKQFYLDKLQANGWQPDGEPVESQGLTMQSWLKDNLSLSITITTNETGGSMVSITCNGCS